MFPENALQAAQNFTQAISENGTDNQELVHINSQRHCYLFLTKPSSKNTA